MAEGQFGIEDLQMRFAVITDIVDLMIEQLQLLQRRTCTF